MGAGLLHGPAAVRPLDSTTVPDECEPLQIAVALPCGSTATCGACVVAGVAQVARCAPAASGRPACRLSDIAGADVVQRPDRGGVALRIDGYLRTLCARRLRRRR